MKPRSLVIVLALGCIAIVVGWVYESRVREDTVADKLEIPDNIDYFLTGLRFRGMNTEGQPDFEFTSRRLEHRRKTDVSHIEAPTVRVFRATANWQIDSRQAAYEHRANLLRMEQDVVLQKGGVRPLRLMTESLVFDPDRDRISTDSNVVMLSGDGRIEADGAVFDLEREVYSLERARGVYN
ncbi:MAG: LPS export ABC transporter periplasmic protein LptC [Gammaproteobacteria bacterium]|nr:LPS export ABC transporter periplasmic protein LptC [Gammaproteobacteria bacterium]